MKQFIHIHSRIRSALLQCAALSAVVCTVAFVSHRQRVSFPRQPSASVARPHLVSAPIAPARIVQSPVKKVPSLLASASEAMPFVGTVETVTVKKRRHHHKKVALKKVLPAAPKKITEPPSDLDNEEPTWLEAGLAAEEQAPAADAEQAIDLYDATDEALQAALAQPELIDDMTIPASLPWQFDQSRIADREIVAERVFAEVAGTYKKNDFSEIRSRLATLSNEADSLAAVEPPPESPLLAMEKADAAISDRRSSAKAEGPSVISGVIETKAAPTPAAATSAMTAPKVYVDPTIAPSELTPVKAAAEPTPVAKTEDVQVNVEKEAAKKDAVLSPVLATAGGGVSEGPTLATGATTILKTAAKAIVEPTLVLPTHPTAPLTTHGGATQSKTVATTPTLVPTETPKREPPPVNPAPMVVASKTASRLPELYGPANKSDQRIIDEKLFGEVLVDGALSQWLIENKAHIELNLHPVGSRDPQDTVYIDYQYPAADFSMDTREMRGAYRLLADIYDAKDKAPYAQVVYPKAISADTAKEKVRFRLSLREVERNKLSSPQRHRVFALSSTIFEGASGDYREPKAVGRGSVDVIGFPELGHIVADADGTFRLPQVPGSSELLLQVQASGYYPSFKVVPTFATDVYAPVYLIARDKVDVITRYFTHHLQLDDNGLVMGRVFDPKTRNPLADEELSLTFRRGPAVYFSALGALPIISAWPGSAADGVATTGNGMFAFFNLKPSMRALSRGSGKPSLLLDVHPQSAEYVELGRGGARNLRGQILDRRSPVPARVRLVGDKRVEVDTDADGNFTIPNLDLPPGVLTLEVEARGYPLTWQTVGWNPREPESVHRFYLLDKDVVYDGAATAARVQVDSRQGLLIGHNSIFPKHSTCVYVSMVDTAGRAVDGAQGPFSLTDAPNSGASGLCLTRQKPWFSFFNLFPGEYVLKLVDQTSHTIRSHVVRIGADRVAVSVD